MRDGADAVKNVRRSHENTKKPGRVVECVADRVLPHILTLPGSLQRRLLPAPPAYQLQVLLNRGIEAESCAD